MDNLNLIKGPLIIGLTGPISSGCTELSRLIETYINDDELGKEFLKSQSEELKEKIIVFYKYLYESVDSARKNLSAISVLDSEIVDSNFENVFLTFPENMSTEYDRKIAKISENFEKKRVYL